MQYIKGYFIGKYKGREVDPLRLKTFESLHFLNVEAGAKLKGCEWVEDFRRLPFEGQVIYINSIPQSDLYFNASKYPTQLPYRENLRNCILLNPAIHSILRKGNYTYGIVEGELLGIIGDLPIQEKATIVEPTPTILHSAYIAPAIELPIRIDEPASPVIPERISTWSWGGCLPGLLGLIGFSWLFWWLLSHHGCSLIKKRADVNLPKTDTTSVILQSDSIYLNSGNIVFSIYDWDVEDHDTVSVYLNGKLAKGNIELNKNVYSWSETALAPGDNELMIESINNGSVGPASPTIELNDGKNNLVFKAGVYKGSPRIFHMILK